VLTVASESDPIATRCEEIRQLLADGLLEKAAQCLTPLWLENTDDNSVIELYAQLMEKCGLNEQAAKTRNLLTPEDRALALFEAAFSLTDARQFAIASMLLKKCDALRPNDPVVNYELGFALMSLSQINQAIVHFEIAHRFLPDFDTTLNLSVCYVLTRQAEKAREYVKKLRTLATTEEEFKEAAHRNAVLNRFESLSRKKNLTPQDWLYILYGGILLRSETKWSDSPDDYKGIAQTLLNVKGLLEGLRHDLEVIEYYNVQSRPLASILSELMEIPLDSYKGPNRPESALLVMDWAVDIVGPHENFIENTGKRLMFAYSLPFSEPLPLVPDIVGYLSTAALMPWNQKTKEDQINSCAESILSRARDLETDPDILKSIQDLVLYYEPKRQQLVLSNPSHFPERPEYSAEVAIPSESRSDAT
jgi:Flp pilus assembly protein TadD